MIDIKVESNQIGDMGQPELSLSEKGKAFAFAMYPYLDCPEVQIITRSNLSQPRFYRIAEKPPIVVQYVLITETTATLIAWAAGEYFFYNENMRHSKYPWESPHIYPGVFKP